MNPENQRPSTPDTGDAVDNDAGELDQGRIAKYQRLREVADPDAVHDLVGRHGIEILDRTFPYLVVAARNRRIAAYRRNSKDYLVRDIPDRATGVDSQDPLAAILEDATLSKVLEAMALLDDRDVLVLWRSAEGVSDEEIRVEWNLRGFNPPWPTTEALRKRRERARQRLLQIVGNPFDDPDGTKNPSK